MTMRTEWIATTALFVLLSSNGAATAVSPGVELKLVGPWAVEAHYDAGRTQVVNVPPPQWVEVKDEKHTNLPLFNARAGGWLKGVQLRGVRAQETTTPYLLDPESLILRDGPATNSVVFRKGEDYEADSNWG